MTIDHRTVMLVAVAGAAMASVSRQPTLASLFGGLVVASLVLAWTRRTTVSDGSWNIRLAALAALSVMGVGYVTHVAEYPSSSLWVFSLAPAALAALLTLVPGSRRLPRLSLPVLAVSGVVFAGVHLVVENHASTVGTDVYLAHLSASNALAKGENPYTDAVRFPNGSPFAAPGTIVEGYPYPPVALLAYAGAELWYGDPRVASLIGWFIYLGLLVWLIGRAKISSTGSSVWAILLVVCAFSGWRLVLFSAWTEPITLGLAALMVVTWRWPRRSGALLGLALASKQYLVLALPWLVRMLRHEPVRVRWALGVALGSLVPWALADPSAMFRAMVQAPLSIGFRPDTLSLPGLLATWSLERVAPLWLAVGLGAAAMFIVRRLESAADQIWALALGMSVFFLFGAAFSNYWFLVMGLCGLAVAAQAGEKGSSVPQESPTDF